MRALFIVVTLFFYTLMCGANRGAPPARSATESQPSKSVPARVDPRVEVLSIVFRLIEANEYNQPTSESAYSRAVAAHFDKYRGHDALALAEKLREERSIGFDAVASFAAHLKDVESCEFLVPLDPWPETLDQRWDPRSAQAFADVLKEFVQDSEFKTFWEAQKPFREIAEARMSELLAKKPIKRWIEEFFGEVIPEGSCVLIGLLNGPANYGSSVRHPDGTVFVFPTIGVSLWDQQGLPVIQDSALGTILHEFCHPFVNPLVDQRLEKLHPAGKVLEKWRGPTMAAQAYVEPRTLLYESLVRACVAHLITRNEGVAAGLAQKKTEISRGFLWTSKLMEALERFESDRSAYPTLRSFMPEIEKALNNPVEQMDTILQQTPQVTRFFPEEGSQLRNPEVAFQIEFDRAMDPSSRGLSFGANADYEVITPGKLDASGKVYTITIRFKPGEVMAYINRNGMGLRSEEGYAAGEKSFRFTILQQ